MVTKLNYIGAKEAEEKVTSLLSKRGKLSVDKDAKTIVVNDVEDTILKVDKMLRAIDIKPVQVAIEANIIEASDTWIRAMGFDWATGSGDIAFKSISGYGNIGATIGLASIKGDVKIVSAPKICALDRQTASILQGTQVAYKTSVSGASGELSDKVEFENIEVVLNVTPRVTANNEIILDVNVKREFPDYTNRMNKNTPPGVGVRKASSQIMLKDGETAVIGGLYSIDTGESDAGVPLMKKIPIIGLFFGKSEDKEMRSELLIFIKAKIKNDQTALAGM
jgi:type IV pilus assembly protein PilQ